MQLGANTRHACNLANNYPNTLPILAVQPHKTKQMAIGLGTDNDLDAGQTLRCTECIAQSRLIMYTE